MPTRTLMILGLTLLAGCKKEQSITLEAPPKQAEPPVAAVAPAPAPAAPAPVDAGAAAATKGRVISLEVTGDGFVPANVKLKAGEAVTLSITRKTDETCATEILIDGTDIKTELPLNKTVEVAWTPAKPGSVKFGCAMDKMVGGVLLVE